MTMAMVVILAAETTISKHLSVVFFRIRRPTGMVAVVALTVVVTTMKSLTVALLPLALLLLALLVEGRTKARP
jgi:hypothetical protein